MNHADHEPGSACGGFLKPRAQYSGRGGVFTVWECTGCGLTNSPAVRRRLDAAWGRIRGRIGRDLTTGAMQMKLRLGINHGGAAVEVTLDLPDGSTPETAAETARMWYEQLDRAHAEQWDRLQAAVPDPPVIQPAPARPAERPAARREERAADNGNGNGRDYGPPSNGRQLIAWAAKHGLKDDLLDLSDKWGMKSRIVDWAEKDCLEAHGILAAKLQPAGRR